MTYEKLRWGIPLRYQIIALIAGSLALSFFTYLFVGTDLIVDDKVSYIYDYNLSKVDSAGQLVDTRIADVEGAARLLARFDQTALYEDYRQRLGLSDVLILEALPQGDSFRVNQVYGRRARVEAGISKMGWKPSVLEKGETVLSSMGRGSLLIGGALKSRSTKRIFYVAELQVPNQFMESTGGLELRLMDFSGRLVVGPKENLSESEVSKLARSILANEFLSGVRDTEVQGESYVVAHKKIANSQLLILGLVPKKIAFSAADSLTRRSLFLGIAIFFLVVGVTLISVRRITNGLRRIWDATRKVSQGDFQFRIDLKSLRDNEVGSLATSFNAMSGKIEDLMAQTAEKARMETELKTAKTVQETLFPPPRQHFGPVRISGYYEPASECAGDWWNYSRIGDQVLLWIGDATGHGAPAALITSAAKSASTVIESMQGITPGKAMQILNHAIYGTSRGKMSMTFFLGVIDLRTGVLTYANASHDPPFLMKNSARPLKRSSLVLLNEVNNPRLGEAAATQYEETSVQLDPGDSVLFYTDGILDLRNRADQEWGERRLIKSILSGVNEGGDLDGLNDRIKGDLFEFRDGSELYDDITYFLCQYVKEASQAA